MRTTSMAGIFHELAQNRTEARTACKPFVVVSLTTKGKPAKIDRVTRQYNSYLTAEEAEEGKAKMERLNPDRHYTIVTM